MKRNTFLYICILFIFITSFSFSEETVKSFRLDKVDNDSWILRNPMTMDKEVVFKKEPAYEGQDILRSVFDFNEDNKIPFAYDISKRALYLDLNKNLDLTDEYYLKDGPFSVPYSNTEVQNIPADGFTVFLEKNNVTIPLNIKMIFFNPLSKKPTCLIYINTKWTGQINLDGKEYTLDVFPNFDTEIIRAADPYAVTDKPDENDRIILDPISAGAQNGNYDPLNALKRMRGSFSGFCGKVIIFEKQYDITYEFKTDSAGVCYLEMKATPINVETVSVAMPGKFIDKFFIYGDFACMFDKPAETLQIPPGLYSSEVLVLDTSSTTSTVSAYALVKHEYKFNAEEMNAITLGGPLNNEITIKPKGRSLDLDFICKGIGGETYDFKQVSSDRKKPPEFRITKGDSEIEAGQFQYG